MDEQTGFRILFRVRIGKTLDSQEPSLETHLDGRQITIKSDDENQPLSESEWVVLSARGFSAETEAQQFGDKLRTAMEIAALSARLGVDTGRDEELSYFNPAPLRSEGILEPDESLVPHRHGLAVLPDKEMLLIKAGPVRIQVRQRPTSLMEAIAALSGQSLAIQSAIAAPLRLLNLALINSDRHAQVLLAFSAVEAAAQTRPWTNKQHEYMTQLADGIGRRFPDSEEHAEIAEAVRRLHRVSLRQSVIRLLGENDLSHLKKQWDAVYGRRSAVVHGKTQLSRQELDSLATDAVQLCGTIILGLIRQSGVQLPPIADAGFESLKGPGDADDVS